MDYKKIYAGYGGLVPFQDSVDEFIDAVTSFVENHENDEEIAAPMALAEEDTSSVDTSWRWRTWLQLRLSTLLKLLGGSHSPLIEHS